jgi:glycine cleavage system H protein
MGIVRADKMAQGLCKYSGTPFMSYRECPSSYECDGCEFEQAVVDWKRGQPWVKLVAGIPYFFKCHTWAKMNRDGLVKIGIDDLAQRLLGVITEIDAPRKGEMIEQNGNAWQVGCSQRGTHMLSPIDGEVVAVNTPLFEDCSALNEDPCGKGWILQLIPSNLDSNAKSLLSVDRAENWIEEENSRLRARVEASLSITAADGGEFLQAIGEQLNDTEWTSLVKEFLLQR